MYISIDIGDIGFVFENYLEFGFLEKENGEYALDNKEILELLLRNLSGYQKRQI